MKSSAVAAAFALGMALAITPGPVQTVLLAESARGGLRRGLAAMFGANCMFAVLLLALAGGLGLVAPTGAAARVIRLTGGIFLLALAADTARNARRQGAGQAAEKAVQGSGLHADPGGLHPTARGVLAVILNPGAWIFLGTTAAAFMTNALRRGGRAFALLTAIAMTAGIVVVDGAVVALAAEGRSRLGTLGSARLALVLAVVLAVLGIAFIASAIGSP